MATIEPDDVVVAADDQLSTTVDDEVVVLNHATGTYHGLSGVGPRIWGLLQEPVEVAALVEALRSEYRVDPERCAHEVTGFLDELSEAALIEVDRGASG